MDITDACMEARGSDGLVREFNRLTGYSLRPVGQPANGINALVDESTGYTDAGEEAFAKFFIEAIWMRLPPECFGPTPDIQGGNDE